MFSGILLSSYHRKSYCQWACILRYNHTGSRSADRCKFANIHRCSWNTRSRHKVPRSRPPNRYNHGVCCTRWKEGYTSPRYIRIASTDRKRWFCPCNFSRRCHLRILLYRCNTSGLKNIFIYTHVRRIKSRRRSGEKRVYKETRW